MDRIFPNQSSPDLSGSATLSDDVRRYLMLALHWAWLFVLLTGLAAGYGYYQSSRQTPVYRASATMLINESRNLNEYANILASERLAQTYSKLMVQLPVLEGVVEELGLQISPGALKGRVSVSVVQDTQLMVVSVEDTDPVRAADIANTIGSVFTAQNQEFVASRYQDSKESLSAQLAQVDSQIQTATESLRSLEALAAQLAEQAGETDSTEVSGTGQPAIVDPYANLTPEQLRERDRLETNLALYRQIYASLSQSFEQVRLAEIQNTSNVVIVEPASPGGKIRPNPSRDASSAAVIGFVIAALIVLVMELLDDTIKGPDEVTRYLGLPVLGLVARIADQEEGPITLAEPRSPISEGFRALRTNIQYSSVDRPLRTLLVTSPSPKDGKSTIAANLAVVLAQSGRSVLITDADMRRPALHKRFGVPNRAGLSDLFVRAEPALDPSHVRSTKVENLDLMTTGGLPPNPAELINSEKMNQIIEMILGQYDLLVIDSPPVMAVTDAAVLAARVDGVVLVIRPGETRVAAARQAVEQLRRSNARLLGVVLNDVENKRTRYYYYYRGYYAYEYQYGYGAGAKNSSARGGYRSDSKNRKFFGIFRQK